MYRYKAGTKDLCHENSIFSFYLEDGSFEPPADRAAHGA